MVTPTVGIEQHPDIVAMRMKYERAAELPVAQMIEGLGFLAGLYLAISPYVVGFNNLPTLTANNLITGIAAALLSLGLASAFSRTHGVAWVVPLIGAWTIVSQWVMRGNVDTTRTIVSNVIVGAVIVLTGLGAVALGMRRSRA